MSYAPPGKTIIHPKNHIMDALNHPLTIIQQKIHTIRDSRVMLDFDLAELYGVETRIINQAVKRNIERFPPDFMFQLSKEELLKHLEFQPVVFEEEQSPEKDGITNPRSQPGILNSQQADNQEKQRSQTVIINRINHLQHPVPDLQRADNQEDQRSQFVTINRIKYLPYAFTEQGIAMLSSVLKSARAIKINIAIMRVFVEMRKFFLTHQDLLLKVGDLAQKVGEHDLSIKTLYEYLKSFDEEQKRREAWENRRPIGF